MLYDPNSFFRKAKEIRTCWASLENPKASKGKGGIPNGGRKGSPCLPLLYYDVDYTVGDFHEEDMLYFYAQGRRIRMRTFLGVCLRMGMIAVHCFILLCLQACRRLMDLCKWLENVGKGCQILAEA